MSKNILECGTKTSGPDACARAGSTCSKRPAMRKAWRKASAVAKRLGRGWQADAWCNLGEHWRAIYRQGTISVEVWPSGLRYEATIRAGDKDKPLAQSTSRSPRKAFGEAVKAAIAVLETESRALAELKRQLEGHGA